MPAESSEAWKGGSGAREALATAPPAGPLEGPPPSAPLFRGAARIMAGLEQVLFASETPLPAEASPEERAREAERRSGERPGEKVPPLGARLGPAFVALVAGPPASGKTALLRSLGERARGRGALVLSASVADADRDRPHGAARALLTALGPEGALALARFDRPSEDPARDGRRRAAGAVHALLDAARARPLLLLLDALEGASEETVDLLAALVRTAAAATLPPGVRLFVALAAREGGQGLLAALAKEAQGPRGALEVDLETSSRPDAAAAPAKPAAGEAATAPPAAEAERTPERLLDLAEEALRAAAPGRARRLARAALAPRAGRRRAGRSAAALTEAERLSPRAAAILGRAAHALADDRPRVDAERKALALEAADALERAAVPGEPPRDEALRLAAQGRALLTAGKDEPARAALARALEAAERAPKEEEPLLTALVHGARAEAALLQGAFRAAVSLLERACERLERALDEAPPGAPRAIPLSIALARAEALLSRAVIADGAPERCLGLAGRAASRARALGEETALLDALGCACDAAIARGPGAALEAQAAARAAWEAAVETADDRARARALERMGAAARLAGRGDEALRRLEEAVGWARASGDRRRIARAAAGLGEAALAGGATDLAVRAWNEAATLENPLSHGKAASAAGPLEPRAEEEASAPSAAAYARALERLGQAYLRAGKPERAIACAARAGRLARRTGQTALEDAARAVESDARALTGALEPRAADPDAQDPRAQGGPLAGLLARLDPRDPPEAWLRAISRLREDDPTLPEEALEGLAALVRAGTGPRLLPGRGNPSPTPPAEGSAPALRGAPPAQDPALPRWRYARIVGRSEPMQRLFSLLDRVAESPAPVLIAGESGTGKELVARAIHDGGLRRAAPFLSINCAALPETLLEAELFGHVKGAFTGADEEKAGLFEAAGRGTLFLDEVGETSPGMQAKLLRVLQEREVRRVGGMRHEKVEARIIAASNKDLARLVEQGLFRVDLFYRLKVISVALPPLRERREDIPHLVEHFLRRFAEETGVRKEVGAGVLEALMAAPWAGNVRELENEVRRAVTLGGPTIERDDLSPAVRGESERPPAEGEGEAKSALTLRERLDIAERRILKEALARNENNKTRTALELGLSRFGLLKKLDKYGLR